MLYSQTERETLVIAWSCEHFHLYLYGHPFTLVTDHKALEVIWTNPRSKPPARIERWGLKLQPYNLREVYRKGMDKPADYMSRHPIPIRTGNHTTATKVKSILTSWHDMPQSHDFNWHQRGNPHRESPTKGCCTTKRQHLDQVKDDSQEITILQKYKQICDDWMTFFFVALESSSPQVWRRETYN